MTISWYPGHMAKAKRQLQEQLTRADVVIEVCDARIPLSSRNPDLDQMVQYKQRIVLLNKADLADPGLTQAWSEHFKPQGLTVLALNSLRSANKVVPLIEAAAKQKIENAQKRGIRKTVRAMVVGVPNVGKSTLINLIKGKSTIKTADMPGVTRSTTWFRVTPYLELMDSPGLLWPKLEDPLVAQRLAYIGSIRDQVHDTLQLCLNLLDELMNTHADMLLARYKLTDTTLRGEKLLEAICLGRGFLVRGGELDIERGIMAVLDEFRGGKIGRITLEAPQ